ncbi:MAG: hypothetical protein Q9218_003374, partial [Villophora microphyllina]
STLALIDDILNTWGRLDVWILSSGLLGPAYITNTTPSDLQKCFEANTYGVFFALKYAPPAMGKLCEKRNYPNAEVKDMGYGSVVVVGSVASGYGGCWGPCYTMSSHAALGVVRSGVTVLKGTGVRINYISPGQIDVGVDLNNFDMRGMTSQLPPASLQSKEVPSSITILPPLPSLPSFSLFAPRPLITQLVHKLTPTRKTQSQKANISLERAGLPTEVARVAGFLASGFSSYITGANLVVDGGAS